MLSRSQGIGVEMQCTQDPFGRLAHYFLIPKGVVLWGCGLADSAGGGEGPDRHTECASCGPVALPLFIAGQTFIALSFATHSVVSDREVDFVVSLKSRSNHPNYPSPRNGCPILRAVFAKGGRARTCASGLDRTLPCPNAWFASRRREHPTLSRSVVYERQPTPAEPTAFHGFSNSQLETVRQSYGFVVAGYVSLMPEHVHLLVGEPQVSSQAVVLQGLKQQTSRKAEKGMKKAQFWQRRDYDFNVWNEKKTAEELE